MMKLSRESIFFLSALARALVHVGWQPFKHILHISECKVAGYWISINIGCWLAAGSGPALLGPGHIAGGCRGCLRLGRNDVLSLTQLRGQDIVDVSSKQLHRA